MGSNMQFSINMQDVVKMSLDTVNGNLNFNFLTRLLEALVIHSGLSKYEMNFTGQDALRAQQVWSGGPDPDEKLLNAVFTLVPEKSDITSEDILSSDITHNHFGEEFNENSKIQNDYGTTDCTEDAKLIEDTKLIKDPKIKLMEDKKLSWREVDILLDKGTLNLKALKKIEKMINVIPTDVKNNSTQEANYIENQLQALTTRVDMFEEMLLKMAPVIDNSVNNEMDLSAITPPSVQSSNSESVSTSQKVVHVKVLPSDIIPDRNLYVSDIIDSRIRKDIKTSSLLNMNDNIENDDIFASYISNRLTSSFPTSEKYILNSHDPVVLTKHIEKLLSRINKCEHDIHMLLGKEACMANCKTSDENSKTRSTISSVDAPDNHNTIYNLRGLRAQETIMKKLIIDPTKFQSVFGLTPKNNDLHETLSVRCFHSFLEDYTDNFQTIHDVLSLHNEVIQQLVSVSKECTENKLDLQKHLDFKNDVNTTILKIQKDIKEYILRDPEAAGIVHFVKDVTCISCAKPAMMKTTQSNLKHPTKGVYAPGPSLNAHVTNEMDKLRKRNIRAPGKIDLDLTTICSRVQPSSSRGYCGQENNNHARGNKILVNDLIRTTPLMRWVQSRSPFQLSSYCNLK